MPKGKGKCNKQGDGHSPLHEQRNGVHGLPHSYHRAAVDIEELLKKEQDPLTKALMLQVLSDEGWSVMEFIQRN
eukprot:1771268-Rhodomonas_salina.1